MDRMLVGAGRRCLRPALAVPVLCAAMLHSASAQTDAAMREILDRLDRLEAQNRALMAKIDALQAELAAARAVPAADSVSVGSPTAGASPPPGAPTVEERIGVQESRTAEQAQSKVEASQRFPIRVTGMALFNAYRDSENSGGSAFPTYAQPGGAAAGATFRQTILGLDYFGPSTFAGGRISGSLRMDFWGGGGALLGQTVRLRTADISIAWRDRSFTVAQDKSLLALREPESLAQVGITSLTGAGNLWLWLPQARFEQDFHFGEATGLRAQVAAIETSETALVENALSGAAAGAYSPRAEPGRPGIEGRLEFFSGAGNRIEIAPGFHHSIAHAYGGSAAADIYSLDWLARVSQFEFTGTVFDGTDTAALGGLQQGVVVFGPGVARAVRSLGGWGQLTWRPGSRVWFNLFAGEEDPRRSDLPVGAIGRNLAYGANIFYRLAPNVLASFEVHQYRTTYVPIVTLLSNHYDLALAYRF